MAADIDAEIERPAEVAEGIACNALVLEKQIFE
jgi:hypothetical protein